MFAALLPVKKFENSKERLAGFLSSQERALLARTMFEDVWAALLQARRAADGLHLLVTTAEPYAISRCQCDGVLCLPESEQRSHSDSVNRATEWARSLGIGALLSVPIDTPAATAEEILSLLELRSRFSVVIVPSADGTGTNALLRTPPDAIAPYFGPGSCQRHTEEAALKGLSHSVVPSPGLSNDIDTPEDLERFAASEHPSSRAWNLVRQFVQDRRRVTECP